MSHLAVLVLATAAFLALAGFLELCDRLTQPETGEPASPGPEEG